jgi:hypothetical protein
MMRRIFRSVWLRIAAIVFCLLAVYPVFVLGTVYATTLRSEFPGGRHGPKDAYRHCLASAIVAYTGSATWVEWATVVMERDGQGSPARAMDAHNNRLCAVIGARAESWKEMHVDVLAAIENGGIDIDAVDRIAWLPPEQWQERLY